MINIIGFICFILSTYACMSNDVIQSVGTFIHTNSKKSNFTLWFFICSILVATIAYGYFIVGDVSFGRLDSIEEVSEMKWWYIIPPIVLIILTKLGITVSTAFLILTIFASGVVIKDMTLKSILGYVGALIISLIVYKILSKFEKKFFNTEPSKIWPPIFWISTACLFSVWLMQNNATMFVFLPRCLYLYEVIIATAIMCISIAIIVIKRGGKIENMIKNKTNSADIRSATIINILYGLILFGCLYISTIPISTTWAFLGALAGRELSLGKYANKSGKEVFKVIATDLTILIIGLVVSIYIARLIVRF